MVYHIRAQDRAYNVQSRDLKIYVLFIGDGYSAGLVLDLLSRCLFVERLIQPFAVVVISEAA
jgi:hypothetical protein